MHVYYSICIAVRMDFRLIRKDILIECSKYLSLLEVEKIALSKVHISVRYLAFVESITLAHGR